LLGLILYTFLTAIPYIGWVVGVIVTAFGLGSAWIAYLERRKEKKIVQNAEVAEDSTEGVELEANQPESDDDEGDSLDEDEKNDQDDETEGSQDEASDDSTDDTEQENSED